MGLFGFGKKDRVIDLSKKYNEERILNSAKVKPAVQQTPSTGTFSFFDSVPQTQTSSSLPESVSDSESIEERRRKLAKRLMDITTKLEEVSNSLYLLQQRVEVLEKKTKVNDFSA